MPDTSVPCTDTGGGWLVVVGDQHVGTCAWHVGPVDEHGDEHGDEQGEAYGHVVVPPEHRRQGYGTEAAAVLTTWVEQRPDVRLLVARLAPEAEEGLRLVARLGFVEHASHPPVLRLVRPAPGVPRPRGRHVC